MKITAVNQFNYHARQTDFNQRKKMPLKNSNVTFQAKGGKFLGGVLGGVAGGAAGGAIIGGGSLAGAALLAASGPIGWGLAALYTIGGTIAGGYVGAGIGDAVTDKKKKP